MIFKKITHFVLKLFSNVKVKLEFKKNCGLLRISQLYNSNTDNTVQKLSDHNKNLKYQYRVLCELFHSVVAVEKSTWSIHAQCAGTGSFANQH